MQEMYDRLWNEMRQMHERCLIAEQAVDGLEKENSELKVKLSALEGEPADGGQEQEAYLERLKNEVKD